MERIGGGSVPAPSFVAGFSNPFEEFIRQQMYGDTGGFPGYLQRASQDFGSAFSPPSGAGFGSFRPPHALNQQIQSRDNDLGALGITHDQLIGMYEQASHAFPINDPFWESLRNSPVSAQVQQLTNAGIAPGPSPSFNTGPSRPMTMNQVLLNLMLGRPTPGYTR